MTLLLEGISNDELKNRLKEFYAYSKSILKFETKPIILLKNDLKNSENIFGKTGYYDPKSFTIGIYTTNRHAKDVIRSLSHELIHHAQNCNGMFKEQDTVLTQDPMYASNNSFLRELEREAFERGDMIFRDWCDLNKDSEGRQLMAEQKIKQNNSTPAEKTPTHPYPELFTEKDRLFKDRFGDHDKEIYQELLRRAIGGK